MNKCVCGNDVCWEMHMNGTASCMKCGLMSLDDTLASENYVHAFQSMSVLCQTQTYTRTKRFKKYLQRACMRQSCNSVPDATWKYLLERKPFSGPESILRCLKQAGRKLRNKCYDCLPLLVHHLCDMEVPVLTDREIACAMRHFAVVDEAFPKNGGFMSYAYALEFILNKMGRADVLPFLSGIQCLKRRKHYEVLLTRIFKDASDGGNRTASGRKQSDYGSIIASCASSKTVDRAQTQPPGESICQQLLAARAQCKSD